MAFVEISKPHKSILKGGFSIPKPDHWDVVAWPTLCEMDNLNISYKLIFKIKKTKTYLVHLLNRNY